MKRSGSEVAAVLTVGLAVLSAGTAAGFLLRGSDPPMSLRAATESETEEVWEPVAVPFTDPVMATLQPSIDGGRAITSETSGIVTHLDCERSQAVSGTSMVAIDDKPLLFLSTERPLWRDLAPGDDGPDVELLQAELGRLGVVESTTGRLDNMTLEGLETLYGEAFADGVNAPDGFSVSRVIWISDTSVELDCAPGLGLGQRVSAGDVLFELADQLVSVGMDRLPVDMYPGPRELLVGEAVLDLDDDLAVTSRADIEALESTDEYRAWVLTNGDVPLAGELRLSEPVDVAAVPPAAVLTVGENACVIGVDDRSYRVVVVASRAGQTLVSPASDLPRSIMSVPGDDLACS